MALPTRRRVGIRNLANVMRLLSAPALAHPAIRRRNGAWPLTIEGDTSVRMQPHKRWTQAHIDDLRLRLRAGASVAEIATATERTPASVSVIMSQLRLRAARPT